MAAVAPLQPAMTVIQLQVPPEAQPGAVVAAQVNGQTIQAQVPPGLQPGDIFSVQVPASAPPAGDPTAAYDTLLANTTRLTLTQPLVSPFPCEGLLFEADNGDKFRVKFDAPGRWIPLLDGYGDGSYHAQVVIGNGRVVQTLSSAGVVPGDLRGVDYQLATCTGCGQWYRPRPPASQSIDRGEALTIQLELPTRYRIYQKCICCCWPEESVRLSRGGGGGFSLVTPPSFYAKCGRAAGCWLEAITGIGTSGILPMCRLLCCGINESASYVAYDAAGTPLGGRGSCLKIIIRAAVQLTNQGSTSARRRWRRVETSWPPWSR